MREYAVYDAPGQGMKWTMLHPRATPEHLGYIPGFLSARDERPAKEQIDANYPFGGWTPFNGFRLNPDKTLSYPGDPPTIPIAKTKLRDEEIYLYQHAWVMILQPDGQYSIARLD